MIPIGMFRAKLKGTVARARTDEKRGRKLRRTIVVTGNVRKTRSGDDTIISSLI